MEVNTLDAIGTEQEAEKTKELIRVRVEEG